MNSEVQKLKIKIFADGADIAGMIDMASKEYIKGLTTNPTHMRKAGISDYRKFASEVLEKITDKPISFEVFSDEFDEMKRQALEIGRWAKNVNVKIPITNSVGESSVPLIAELCAEGVNLNVTALMTEKQVERVATVLQPGTANFVSVFAGRVADTGVDPIPLMQNCLKLIAHNPDAELIWASPRELLNIVQADQIGCHVITVTNDLLKKLENLGKDLEQFSLETVQMFRSDAVAARFEL